MKSNLQENVRVRSDLLAVFHRLPNASLCRLFSQRSRLTQGVWRTAGGLACLLALLAEGLPSGTTVFDMESFLEFLSNAAGQGEAGVAVVLAARNIVRLWDGHGSDVDVQARYGDAAWLSPETVYSVLQEVMEKRGLRTTPRGDDRRSINATKEFGRGNSVAQPLAGRSTPPLPPTLSA